MALKQHKFIFNKSARTSRLNPDTNYSTGEKINICDDEYAYTYTYYGIDKYTLDTSEGVELAKIHIFIDEVEILYPDNVAPGDGIRFGIYGCRNKWNEDEITYNNAPASIFFESVPVELLSEDQTGWVTLEISPEQFGKIHYLLENGLNLSTYTPYMYGNITAFSTRAEEGLRPFLEIWTDDGRPVTEPTQPKGITAVSTNVRFEWTYSSKAIIPAKQKRYEIQLSEDGNEWITIVNGTGNNKYHDYEAPGYFNVNIKYWRIRVTDENDAISDWSSPQEITVIMPPSINIVDIEVTPKPLITWTEQGQRGYQVKIGNYDSGPLYGFQNSFKSPVYIPDGITQIGLRVVGEYGLWSNWVYEEIEIKNTPGEEPANLNATATHRATLEWDGNDEAEYTVIRDGKEIAALNGTSYVDELVIGRHIYQVRRNEGDYYTLSNPIELEMKCRYPMITAVNDIDWLEIKDTLTATPGVRVSRSAEINYMYYAGRKRPVAETNGFVNDTLDFSAAFRNYNTAKVLYELGGCEVCYKDPRDNIITGTLENLSGSIGRMYSELSGTIVATEERP